MLKLIEIHQKDWSPSLVILYKYLHSREQDFTPKTNRMGQPFVLHELL